MARERTLGELKGDLRYLADAQGLTLRHTDSDITRALNQSIQRFRGKVSAEGLTHFLLYTSGTMPVGVTSPFGFGVIDLTAVTPACVQIYGIDVQFSGGCWDALDAVEFTERNRYASEYGNQTRPPVAFANFQTCKAGIFPASDSAYPYVAWYLPLFEDLANDSDAFDGVAGWEEWVVWDATIPMINRDQYPQAYAMATAERAERWNDIIRVAAKVNRGSVTRRRDTWGESMHKRARSRDRWP